MIWLELLSDKPLIHVSDTAALEGNVNGPSLVRVPDWVERPLGRYYLYFASHTGRSIRLAVADELAGPWRLHAGGALRLEDSLFPTTAPKTEDLHPEARALIEAGHDGIYPHIASPDVVIDEVTRTFRLYYHGRIADGRQPSRVAVSTNGVDFVPQEPLLGRPYMRAFRYEDWWYLVGMPGHLYRSVDGLSALEAGHNLFAEISVRHVGLWVRGTQLYVFWTQVGDAPERIKLSTVDLSRPWSEWQLRDDVVEVRRPERPWEGGGLPIEPSLYGGVHEPVNQLRDPAVFVEDEQLYLLYAVAGEQGVAMGRVCGL